MGFLDAIFRPNRHRNRAMNRALDDFSGVRRQTDPFFSSLVEDAGGAQSMLAALLGVDGPQAQELAFRNFSNSPGFDFALGEGTRAIDQSAAARGMGRSGATLRALQEHGQNLHNLEFGNHLSRLGGLVSQGQTGASGLTGNSRGFGNMLVQRGASRDAGNATRLGNILGIAGTVAGAFGGMPFGRTPRFSTGGFGGGLPVQMGHNLPMNPQGRLF